MRSNARVATLLLLLALGLTACSGADDESGATTEPDSPRVVVEPLSAVAARAGGSAAADVVPLNDSTLSAEMAATVRAVHADVGRRVQRGDDLIELDPTDYRLALSQADAQVAAAQAAANQADARLVRARDLHGRKFVSDDDLGVAVTQAEAANAELRIRRSARDITARQLEKTRVVAPFDAVVVQRMAQVGNAVAAGTPLLRLIDLGKPQVEVRLQPDQASQLAAATTITLHLQNQRFALQVLHVADAADPGSRTRVARLGFVDAAPQPGLSGTLHWSQPGFEIASSLLVQRGNGLGLFTVTDARAKWIALPGASSGRAVMADLPADLPVVTFGQQSLQDGDSVVAGDERAAADTTGTR